MSTLQEVEGRLTEDVIESHSAKKETAIRNLLNTNVQESFDGTEFSFPQNNRTHRHVYQWNLLETGQAVGINESPRNGLSVVIAGKKMVQKHFPNLSKG